MRVLYEISIIYSSFWMKVVTQLQKRKVTYKEFHTDTKYETKVTQSYLTF